MKDEIFIHRIDATESDDQFLKKYQRFMIGELSREFKIDPRNFQNDQRYQPIIEESKRYYYFIDLQNKRYCVLITCANEEPIKYEAISLHQ